MSIPINETKNDNRICEISKFINTLGSKIASSTLHEYSHAEQCFHDTCRKYLSVGDEELKERVPDIKFGSFPSLCSYFNDDTDEVKDCQIETKRKVSMNMSKEIITSSIEKVINKRKRIVSDDTRMNDQKKRRLNAEEKTFDNIEKHSLSVNPSTFGNTQNYYLRKGIHFTENDSTNNSLFIPGDPSRYSPSVDLKHIPKMLLHNHLNSFALLLDARVNAFITILRKHLLNLEQAKVNENSQKRVYEKIALMEEIKRTISFHWAVTYFSMEDVQHHEKELAHCPKPISFNSKICVNPPFGISPRTTTITAPGSITAYLNADGENTIIEAVKLQVDTNILLNSMIEMARNIVDETIDVISKPSNETYALPKNITDKNNERNIDKDGLMRNELGDKNTVISGINGDNSQWSFNQSPEEIYCMEEFIDYLIGNIGLTKSGIIFYYVVEV